MSALDRIVSRAPGGDLSRLSAWFAWQAEKAKKASFEVTRVLQFGPKRGRRPPIGDLYPLLSELETRGVVRWDKSSARPYAGVVRYRRFHVNLAMLGLEEK